MISLVILLIALVAILSISMVFMKSNLSLGNYVVMANQSRFFTEQLGVDLRSTVNVAVASGTRLTLTVEDPDGNQSTVAYRYRAESGTLTRTAGSGSENILIENLSTLTFGYYDSKDSATTNALDIKKIDVVFSTHDSVGAVNQSQDTRVARFVLRNRVVASN